MDPIVDSQEVSWLTTNTSGLGRRNSLVPHVFDSYARIFFPPLRYFWRGPVNSPSGDRVSEIPISWHDVAALTGKRAHPWMQWGSISGQRWHEVDLGDGTSLDIGLDGQIPRGVLDHLLPSLMLHTCTPSSAFAAIWMGLLAPPAEGRFEQSEFSLHERDYVLLRGPLADLQNEEWASVIDISSLDSPPSSPQIMWPSDHSWCLGVDLDDNFAVLGGSENLIADIKRLEGVESLPLVTDGDLGPAGDVINLPPERID